MGVPCLERETLLAGKGDVQFLETQSTGFPLEDPELQQCDDRRPTGRRTTRGAVAAGGVALVLVAAATLLAARTPGHGLQAALMGDAEGLESVTCAEGRSDCKASQCCRGSGLQCYEQDAGYAQCRATCTTGPDPTHWDGKDWSCKELGARTAGEPACGKTGSDCRQSKCCADPGFQCYQKNASWATCKAECIAGAPDLTDVDNVHWSCKELGERTPGAQDWVQSQCSSGWENCAATKCCKNQGEQCYLQNDYFGECKTGGSCPAGWSCNTAGSVAPAPPTRGGKLSPWVLEGCSQPETGCTSTKCCVGMDVQCYEKDANWAQCKSACQAGVHPEDGNATWSCKELGPRSYGVATKGFPSLYCFSVIRTAGYEVSLMQAVYDRGAGIFACDDYDLFTADGTVTIGGAVTLQFQGAPIVNSIDNTAGNTELFVHAWNKVVEVGKWSKHAFIVKVDPDAAFIPDRLRWHVAPYVAQKIFVINCHVGDMIYGALEVFSYHAIKEWVINGNSCFAPNNYGEDLYMTRCMDHLGVARIHDESIMGDKLCGTFSDCSNGWNAAFHPFKDIGSYASCLDAAGAVAPPR